jgi:glycosyltransferase involved in cell wall biosynthesis
MKVCLVSALPPFRSGVSLYSVGLLSGFERIGPSFPVVILANKCADKPVGKSQNIKLAKTWTKGPGYLFQIVSAVAKEKPKLVHIQHEFFLYGGIVSSAVFPLLLFLLRLMGIKVVVTMHGVIPRKVARKQFADAFFIPANFIALKVGLPVITMLISANANAIVVHDKSAKNTLHEDYGVAPQKINVIPHGIGLPNLEPLRSQRVRENTVLFFGNITPSKGLDTLIAAFEHVRVPNAKLIIAGGPHPRGNNYFQQIMRSVRSSSTSDRITMTGYIPDERIHSLFEECSLAVFPYTFSVSSSGGLSFALQHRKPVIVTDLPTFTQIITDDLNGLVVPPEDSRALTSAIERILLDHDLRNLISNGIMKSLSYLTWPAIAKETSECYRVLLTPTNKGSSHV